MKTNYKIYVNGVRYIPKEFFAEFGVPKRTFHHKLSKNIKAGNSDFTMLFKIGDKAVSCKIKLT